MLLFFLLLLLLSYLYDYHLLKYNIKLQLSDMNDR